MDSKDYLELTRLNLLRFGKVSDRVWAHRVGTLGKLQEALRYFKGIELDVVFHDDASGFYVYHPPKENIGLTLDEYLAAARHYPDVRLWLDWKNAAPSNIAPALTALAALDRKYNLKPRTLVETAAGPPMPGSPRCGQRLRPQLLPSPEGVGVQQTAGER